MDVNLWLHTECGYNFFNIPKLTYFEINGLIGAMNRKIKKQEQEHKKAEQKARRLRR